MKLKEMRLKKKMEQQELAQSAEVSVPMMSYFENYKCLPTPATMHKITTKLDCEVSDIYQDDEIYIKKNKITKSKNPNVYNVSVRLSNRMREILTQENLELLGFHSLKDFIWHCCIGFESKLKSEKEKTTTKSDLVVGQESYVNNSYITIRLHCSQEKSKKNKEK